MDKIEVTKIIIDQMKKAGEDTSLLRPVDFLFIGNRTKLDELEQFLIKNGFIKIPSNYSEPEKSLLVSKNMTVDSLLTTNIISEMENAAKEFSVVFDGWETIPAKK